MKIMKRGFRGGVVPTLNAMDNNGEAYATVLISAVDFYNATLSDTSQTIRAHTATAVNIGGVMIFSHTQGLDIQPSETNSPTLRTGGAGMAVAYDEFNDSISDVHHTLRAGTKQSTGVLDSVVRRLTPTECERLQGFPDGWTDGQADSNRYKQMGNAVAVPVVEWIISRMVGEVSE
jgi:site-specific DNA-cytosine methylase